MEENANKIASNFVLFIHKFWYIRCLK